MEKIKHKHTNKIIQKYIDHYNSICDNGKTDIENKPVAEKLAEAALYKYTKVNR